MKTASLYIVGCLLFIGNIQCTSSNESVGVVMAGSEEGLRDYRGNGPSGSGSQTGYEGWQSGDAFAERQGPLCIGLKPPEDAYLPIEEPESETDTEEARPDGENDVEIPSDVVANASETQAEMGGEDGFFVADMVEEAADTEDDARGMQVFSQEEDSNDNPETQIGGIPSIPEIPSAEEEESEPYDCTPNPATCVGAEGPEFALFDFQPQSCGFQATYGLDLYKNHVTLVALLAAW